MRGLSAIFRDERGQALVLAVGFMAILSIVSTGLLLYTSSNSRDSSRSATSTKAFAAAEAGVNSAVSVLGLSTNNALDPCLLHPPTNPTGTTCASNAPVTASYDGGTVTWYGTFDQVNQVWTIRSTGSYRNPTGASASAVTRADCEGEYLIRPETTPTPPRCGTTSSQRRRST